MLPIVFWPPSCHELHGVKLFTYDVVSKEFYIVKDSFSVLPNIFSFFGDRKDVFGYTTVAFIAFLLMSLNEKDHFQVLLKQIFCNFSHFLN